MTKKEILYHVDGSPFMQSLRKGTPEQLHMLRKTIYDRINKRRRNALYSCFLTVLIAPFGSTFAILISSAASKYIPLAYSIGVTSCVLC